MCKTAEHRQGGHCAAPRARHPLHGGSTARAAAQNPIAERKPADARRDSTLQGAARRHAIDTNTSRAKKGRVMVKVREATEGRLHPRGHGSASYTRAGGTATLPTPSPSSCMQRLGIGPGRGTEAADDPAPPSRTEHRPIKGNAPHRRGQKLDGSTVARFRLGTWVRDPPYRYKSHTSLRRHIRTPTFLDRVEAPGGHAPAARCRPGTRPAMSHRLLGTAATASAPSLVRPENGPKATKPFDGG